MAFEIEGVDAQCGETTWARLDCGCMLMGAEAEGAEVGEPIDCPEAGACGGAFNNGETTVLSIMTVPLVDVVEIFG